MRASLVPAAGPSWPTEIDRIRRLLGAPGNPALLPPHFLQVTFPKIGGRVILFGPAEMPHAVGFLFPDRGGLGQRRYLLRVHPVPPVRQFDAGVLTAQLAALVDGKPVRVYDPLAAVTYRPSDTPAGDLSYGTPDADEAEAIRSLQQQIWDAHPDLLYPVDIHSASFEACLSQVARLPAQSGARPRPVGFLFGFLAFDGVPLPPTWQGMLRHDLRLESQALGVLPAYRGRGIATLLKQAQADQARQLGIDLVHWTADPLQAGNAVLNLVHLGAVAGHFWPDYYPMQNALNRVSTSRIGITWLVTSARVRQRAQQGRSAIADLGDEALANDGCEQARLDLQAPRIAFEIPARWTEMQGRDPAQAGRWRQVTDALFQHYLGVAEGRYLLTGVAARGERRFLVAERVSAALLERVAA